MNARVLFAACLLACQREESRDRLAHRAPIVDTGVTLPDAALEVLDDAELDTRPQDSLDLGEDGTAKMKLRRQLVDGTPLVSVVAKLPVGWEKRKSFFEGEHKFVPRTRVYDRPSITFNVQMDNLDPDTVKKQIDEKVKELHTVVVGLGKIKVLSVAELPNGKRITRRVDAQKERSIVYVETTCLVFVPGQRYVVQMQGFAEDKDANLVPEFEKVCESVSLAPWQ